MAAAPARSDESSMPTGHAGREASAGFTIVLVGFGLLVMTGVIIGSRLGDVPISVLTRDPMAVLRGHPFTGALSNLGVLLWTATVSICGLTLWARGDLLRRMGAFEYVAGGALLTSVLLFDDLFMVHEYLAPRFLRLRASDRWVLAAYAGLTAVYFWRIRRLLSIRDHLLMAACTFFVISLGVDQLVKVKGPWYHVWEDGSKFLGILAWFGHYTILCRGLLDLPGTGEVAEEERV